MCGKPHVESRGVCRRLSYKCRRVNDSGVCLSWAAAVGVRMLLLVLVSSSVSRLLLRSLPTGVYKRCRKRGGLGGG